MVKMTTRTRVTPAERGESRRRFDEESGELPSAELIIQELEKHLNLRRKDDDTAPPKRLIFHKM